MIFKPEIESMERSSLEALQLQRLQQTVQKVYANVDFYQELFAKQGLHPQDINTLEDVQKLPFTVKKNLREHYPYGLFATPLKDVVRLHASSGTSGKPTVVGYTHNDIDHWADMIARSIVAAGGKADDVLHNAYGYGLFTGGLGLHHGGEKLGITTVPVSGGNTKRQIMLIDDFKPRVICATPSYALRIAETMEDMGKDPRTTSLQYGIFGAEPWSEEMRHTLEEKMNIKAVDIYGLSEVMGPGVAIECHEVQDGLHIQEDHFLVEVIDPDTLQPVPDGEFGELVITTLTKEALPVVRYRTGDITSITKEKCKCGRTTTRMSRVKGRIDDMLIIRGVNVFPSEMERSLLKVNDLAPYYQVHLRKEGHLDMVELNVEVSDETYRRCGEDIQHMDIAYLRKKTQRILKEECLVNIEVNIRPPKSIPRSEGKAVRIVNKRERETV